MNNTKFPVLVILKNAKKYLDSSKHDQVVNAVGKAMQPYATDLVEQEYPWLGLNELQEYMYQFTDSFLDDMSKSERDYNVKGGELYRDIFEDDKLEVLQSEKFDQWIKILDPMVRWDKEIQMLYSSKNPDSRWSTWRIGGMFSNMFIWAYNEGALQKVTGAWVHDVNVPKMIQLFENVIPSVLINEKNESMWLSKINAVPGGFSPSCSKEEWEEQIAHYMWDMNNHDFLVIVECVI